MAPCDFLYVCRSHALDVLHPPTGGQQLCCLTVFGPAEESIIFVFAIPAILLHCYQRQMTQRLSFAERTRIQKEFELLQQKREDKLHQHEEEQRAKFLAELEAKRLAEEQKQTELRQRIEKEKAAKLQAEQEERLKKKQEAAKQAQIEAKRAEAIKQAEAERRQRADAEIKEILAQAATEAAEREKRVQESKARQQAAVSPFLHRIAFHLL